MKKRMNKTHSFPKVILAMGMMMSLGAGTVYAVPLPSKAQEMLQVSENTQVYGTVVDENGDPVIGASVLVVGMQFGTSTDINGKFVLKDVKNGATLQISYVGYETITVKITSSTIKVKLVPSAKNLDEVVVTALGIKRQTKALGYSVQEIKGNSITEARENNIISSLSGKFAGVQVSGSGNGSMGSSRIIIRGNNSISGSNEPLIVVDGVPMDNFSGSGGLTEWGSSDTGNGLADINPDDIESISVLKGPAAAALYGTRAGNGVLMITTKKGGDKKKGLGVTWNSNVTVETPLMKPEMQNLYGQGTNGVHNPNGNLSWGPKMEGQTLTDWMGNETPYKAYDNDLNGLLRTGVATTQTLEAGYNTEKGSVRATLSYQHIDGIVPSNYQDKWNINLRNTLKLSNRVSLDMKINYIKNKLKNTPDVGASPKSIMSNYLMMPRNIHISDMKPVFDIDGKLRRYTEEEQHYVINTFFNPENEQINMRDRFIGFMSLNYDITDWLTLKLRHGEDIYWSQGDSKITSKAPWNTGVQGSGSYSVWSSKTRERNTDFLVTANKENWWGSKFSGNLSFGGNMLFRQSESMSENSGKLNVPDFFAVSNGTQQSMDHNLSKKAINSLYGFLQLNYGNWIFLDATARNDWSSTLPKNNRSFFYPSVGLGLVISDMLTSYGVTMPEWFTFAKVRGSYAEVGNDTGPYSLSAVYSFYNVTSEVMGTTVSSWLPLANLKPENIKSTEIGVDLRFFNNRLGIDFSWYKKNATNQIIGLPTSPSSGYGSRTINAGNIQNSGVEVVLTGTPIQTRNWEWNTIINYNKNTNKILELHPELKVYEMAKTSYVNIVAREGGNYGDLVGRRFERNDKGQIIVGENGLPKYGETVDSDNPIGNYLPKWMGSMTNTIRYKNLTLGFMLDLRVGGDIYINSLARGAEYGTTKMTLEGRDEWYAGTGGIVFPGVTEDGQPNTKAVNPQEYWNHMKNASEQWVYDGTNLRLRELTIGYTFPKSILEKTPFTSLKISAVGRNLWIIHSKIPGFDPESSISTGNAGGFEYASLPTLRSFGINLNVSF